MHGCVLSNPSWQAARCLRNLTPLTNDFVSVEKLVLGILRRAWALIRGLL